MSAALSETPAKTKKERKPVERYKGPLHTVELKLEANPREAQILFERLRVVQKLKNDVKGLLLKRVNGMRNDPRFRQAARMPARTEAEVLARRHAFSLLRADCLLDEKSINRLGEQVLKHKGWMREILTVQIVNKAGQEAWHEVEQWLYGKKGKPHFRRSDEPTSVWGNQLDNGIMARDGYLVWNSLAPSRRKSLKLKIDYSSLSSPRRAHFDSLEVMRYGVSRKRVRGQWVYFLLVCLKGEPYRNEDYLASVAAGLSGVDPGISYMAVVSDGEAEVIELILPKELAQAKARARHERRLKRRIGRSRRAMNPEAFDKKGRSLKGVRQPKLGREARRFEGELRESERRGVIQRRQRTHETSRKLMEHGTRLVIERNSFKAFQRLWGKRMGLTAPAQFLSILTAEALRVGGSVVFLETFTHCLSQYCLCGARRKKDRSETTHHCTECDLEPLDRNLFSAYLARLLALNGLHEQPQVLRKAPFRANGYREEAARLCAARPGLAALRSTQASSDESHPALKARVLAGDQEAQTPRECRAVQAHQSPLPDTSRQAGAYPNPP